MSTEHEKGGFFERTQGHISPVLVEHYYGPRMARSDGSFLYLVQVMEAHVLMMGERGIIPREAAGKMLVVMEGWREKTPELDPTLEDLYINFERLMTAAVGEQLAGYLPAARSRNDVEAAMWRMELRGILLNLGRAALEMAETLHTRAAETADWLFPGYTYRQQAQPITMGYHLLGVAAGIQRDASRILDCIGRLNKNPLGAAAMSGTEYPIDRARTAQLLGFDGVWEHAEDAVSSADYMLEAAGAALNHLVTQARLAEDIIMWCSNETGFADLADDLIDSSSIMPQKRNPVICATVRAQARLEAGRYAGICAACTAEFQATRDMTAAWEDVLACVKSAYAMCKISTEYTRTLRFSRARMERSLALAFSNATELADSLVIQGGLPFRAAHKIVGGAISELYDAGAGHEALTYELLDRWSRDVTNAPLPLTHEQFLQACDFRVAMERRGCQGGCAPKEQARMLQQQKAECAALAARFTALETAWKEADGVLRRAAQTEQE